MADLKIEELQLRFVNLEQQLDELRREKNSDKKDTLQIINDIQNFKRHSNNYKMERNEANSIKIGLINAELNLGQVIKIF